MGFQGEDATQPMIAPAPNQSCIARAPDWPVGDQGHNETVNKVVLLFAGWPPKNKDWPANDNVFRQTICVLEKPSMAFSKQQSTTVLAQSHCYSENL